MELKEAYDLAAQAFKPEESYKIDWVLEAVLGVSKTDRIIEPNRVLDQSNVSRLKEVLLDVKEGRPLAYIFNEAYFLGRPFYVDERVLIPRYDTEQSVDVIENLDFTRPSVLEIGTGSGCVALSLGLLHPKWKIKATDISTDALEVASINQRRYGIKNVDLVVSDLFENIKGTFDLIYSNPPYITEEEMEIIDASVVKFEPNLALRGGEDGLDFYRRITREAPRYLNGDGYLVYEIGKDQGEAVCQILEDAGFCDVKIQRDFAGLDRVVYGRFYNV